MKKNIRERIIAVAVSLLVVSSASLVVGAEGYTYNSYGKTVAVPDIYEPTEKYTGNNFASGAFNGPSDFCVDKNGSLYVADTGNNRIVIIDSAFGGARVLSEFILDGEKTALYNPKSVFVSDPEEIYIADTDNERILRCDGRGEVNLLIKKPEISQFSETLFLPTGVLVDNYGNIYARCTGIYQGLVMFDKNGDYQCFFGSETVRPTAAVQLQHWWKSLMNDEQKEQLSRYVPTEIKGIDIDSSGYIYTVAAGESTEGVKNNMDSIRRLNTLGRDILVNKMNPNAWKAFENDARSMNFCDMSVDENNFLTLIDNRQGIILIFDNQMQLLDVLGGFGDEAGKYLLPSAVETFSDRMYILDSTAGSITVYNKTAYGKDIYNALILYKEGRYGETIDAWNEIIKNNTNCELAYDGLGNAYLSIKDYRSAIDCFEKARNSEGYNEAFKYIRSDFIKKYFVPAVAVIAIALTVGFIIYKRRKGKGNVKI